MFACVPAGCTCVFSVNSLNSSCFSEWRPEEPKSDSLCVSILQLLKKNLNFAFLSLKHYL